MGITENILYYDSKSPILMSGDAELHSCSRKIYLCCLHLQLQKYFHR